MFTGGNRRRAAADGRGETEHERADRNLNELLQELRVAQTGVQILFAFLLTVPFTQRYGEVNGGQNAVYLGTLLATALATVCLIAPVSQHRVLFRRGLKPELIQSANRLASAGLVFLMLAVIGSVFLIIDVVVDARWAAVVGAALAVLFLLTWYVEPLLLRARHRD